MLIEVVKNKEISNDTSTEYVVQGLTNMGAAISFWLYPYGGSSIKDQENALHEREAELVASIVESWKLSADAIDFIMDSPEYKRLKEELKLANAKPKSNILPLVKLGYSSDELIRLKEAGVI